MSVINHENIDFRKHSQDKEKVECPRSEGVMGETRRILGCFTWVYSSQPGSEKNQGLACHARDVGKEKKVWQ